MFDPYDKLTNICTKKLESLSETTSAHRTRLSLELKEADIQNSSEYFLDLHDSAAKYDNENNLIIPYLLGICDEFDINKESKYEYGDFPDVDIDFIPAIRSYLKEKYARNQFGEEYVCNISTYTTFGLRSALIDMSKVFDLDRREMLALTTRLGIKDDEGEILTWDKAIELYDDLREYLEGHPDMADAARRILHRNRNMGMHASGLIISGTPIKGFVPLVRVKDTAQSCSAWVEGLHGTDLGAVGLVKFDFLSLDNNMKIAAATKVVNETTPVSALPGKGNWSDTSYLDDPKALEMADKGDLKMIFQYDGSEGIRRLAKQGGVTSFNDLVAYTALYRPGPMKLKYHEVYCARKRGKEDYVTHPILDDFMDTTYGVLVYQEQLMKILNLVGKIPLRDCEAVRKAISKKQIGKFAKYKEMFIANGQTILGWTADELEHLFKQIEAFAGYGFNLAHATAYAYISARMLYLKAHHPLAFYSSVLSHTRSAGPKDYRKLKDYKREAERHGIKVNRLDINKSKFDCEIVNGEIYYGFSKIKGIGDENAAKIVNLQPYTSYEDFLHRFGIDAKANQAVIAMRLFDGDPITLYKFYKNYKVAEKKRIDRKKRYENSLAKYKEKIAKLTSEQNQKELSVVNRRMNTVTLNYHKRSETILPTLSGFQACECDIEIDEDFAAILNNNANAEDAYYGFIWSHQLEECSNYTHKTLEEFSATQTEVGPIEVQIRKVTQMKGPKATYYAVNVEDASGDTARITVWKDDHERFADELVKDNCVRLQVMAPTLGFNNYTLASCPNRYKKPPKELDSRVIVIN